MQAGQPLAPGVDSLETDVPYADDGHVVVDVKAQVTADLRARLNSLGVEVLSSAPDGSGLRLHIDIDQVQALAALPDVVFVQPKQDAITSRPDASAFGRPMTREAWVRGRMARKARRPRKTLLRAHLPSGTGRKHPMLTGRLQGWP